MKKLWIVLVLAFLLPGSGYAESREWVREPAAKKESTKKAKAKKKKAAAKKAKGKKTKSTEARNKRKKVVKTAAPRSHAPKQDLAPEVGEIPEHLKDDLPPPNSGDLTE
jgi:hypothetical protein